MDEFRFYCTYCDQKISKGVIVKCAVCDNVTLCPKCFSKGKQVYSHKRDHDYQIFVCAKDPIYQKKWMYEEELKLLEGLETAGFGNWEEIAKRVKTKTSHQCRDHFEQVYLTSRTFPFPSQTKILSSSQRLLKQSSRKRKRKRKRKKNQKTKEDFKKKFDRRRKKLNQKTKYNKNSKSTFAILTGFMSKREDFEVLPNNDCENIIESFGFDDEKISWNVKYQVLQAYNLRIEERDKKRQFVLKMGLHNCLVRNKKLLRPSNYFDDLSQIGGELKDNFQDKILKGKRKTKNQRNSKKNKIEKDNFGSGNDSDEKKLESDSESGSGSGNGNESEVESDSGNENKSEDEGEEDDEERIQMEEFQMGELVDKKEYTQNQIDMFEKTNIFARCFKTKKEFQNFQQDFTNEFQLKYQIQRLISLRQQQRDGQQERQQQKQGDELELQQSQKTKTKANSKRKTKKKTKTKTKSKKKKQKAIKQNIIISTPKSKRKIISKQLKTKKGKKKLKNVITTPRTRPSHHPHRIRYSTKTSSTLSSSKKKHRILTHN
ncbi:transcriptional adapter 2-alpha [Anaeramoeba flamelloides]|uniref:Transcriptional adapter 2-alpha n=1 Tax=Anaeramoeba flamelloides TaxID=1746091 RepID=A0AAV7ZKX1_9EUKA|nr:transcriptional adapter 2-alpha [Anaeramoeba flamelloides]